LHIILGHPSSYTVNKTLQQLHSEYLIYVEHFIFFFISVAPDAAEGICTSSLNAERVKQ
jgi:hypothetical protein